MRSESLKTDDSNTTAAVAGPGTDGRIAAAEAVSEALEAVIGERVRELRRQHGWTVARLAEASGLSKGMLSKIEHALSAPSLATLARLAQALGVPVTALFRGLSEEEDVVFVKAGGGLDIHHKDSGPGHRYQMLGSMRAPYDTLEPMLVTLTERSRSSATNQSFPMYQHAGTELIYMVSGKMEYCHGSSTYLLEPGDSMQFAGEVLHGPGELIQLPIQFLAVKAVRSGG